MWASWIPFDWRLIDCFAMTAAESITVPATVFTGWIWEPAVCD